MFFAGLGTATPSWRYSQQECWDALRSSAMYEALQPRSRALCRRVFSGTNGIASRYLALERLEDALAMEPDRLQARFERHAPDLAIQASRRALQQAGVEPRDLDAVLISTCTGYLCPGLTSYVAEALGVRPDAWLLDLVGQGCGAAIPNLRTAAGLIESRGAQRVLSVCVEVCSAAFYLDDDPGVIISLCLFGDGAGAAVVTGEPSAVGGRQVRWVDAATALHPAERDLLRFETRKGMLRNILAPEVPPLAARFAGEVFDSVAARRGFRREDIATWVLHAGGREVLVALGERLALSKEDVAVSTEILRDHGNLSSAFVYFVLQDALQRQQRPGWWWMASFGAGFSSHGALLEVR